MDRSGLYCTGDGSHTVIELNIDLCPYAIFSHIGVQYSVAEYTRLTMKVLIELKSALQSMPVSFCIMLLQEPIFPVKLLKCVLYVRTLSNIAPSYLERGSCFTSCPQKVIFRFLLAILLLKENKENTIFLGFERSPHCLK